MENAVVIHHTAWVITKKNDAISTKQSGRFVSRKKKLKHYESLFCALLKVNAKWKIFYEYLNEKYKKKSPKLLFNPHSNKIVRGKIERERERE